MLAHYLLGRCYDDMGEAPAALQEFHNAVDAADTTKRNCEYRTLARVRLQTGYLFLRQMMPAEAISEYRSAYAFAKLAKDTLAAINSFESLARPYYMQNKIDSAMDISLSASEQYRRLGYMTQAARAISLPIYLLINDCRLDEALHYIERYEQHGELFDDSGILKRPTGLIYAFKGEYYLSKGNLDSAKHYFYKDIASSANINNRICSYRGLAKLYHSQQMNDSAYKYIQLYAQSNDSSTTGISTQYMSQMQSMYNYERNKQKAEKAERKAQEFRHLTLYLSCLFLMAALLVGIFIYFRRKANKQRIDILCGQYALLNTQHIMVEEHLKQMTEKRDAQQRQIAALHDERMTDNRKKEALVRDLELSKSRIKGLENEKGQIEEELQALRDNERLKAGILSEQMIHSSTISYLHHLATVGKKAMQSEWDNLIFIMNDNIPSFIPKLKALYPGLDERHVLICIMVKLRFELGEIACLLDISPQILSNDRKRLNEKMFGIVGTTKGFDERIRNLI